MSATQIDLQRQARRPSREISESGHCSIAKTKKSKGKDGPRHTKK